MNNERPQPGTIWQHKNGIHYRVIFTCNEGHVSSDYPVTVVYENCETGTKWCRPMTKWRKSFTLISAEVKSES